MKQRIWLAAGLWVVASVALAQGDFTKIHVVLQLDGMDGARVERDQVFSEVEGTSLRFDAYYPGGSDSEAKRSPRPAIVFVSGAGDVRGWEWFRDYGKLAAAQGLVGLVPDKRYSRDGDDPLRTGHEDTERFLRYVAEHGAELGVDPEHLCVWTFSAGGRMAAVVLKRGAPSVQCLVTFYSVLDASNLIPADSPERSQKVAQYSPIHALRDPEGAKPPTLVVRAGKDMELINTSIETFVKTAGEVGAPVRLLDYAEGVHGFDGTDDTDESRATVEEAFRFVAEQVGSAGPPESHD